VTPSLTYAAVTPARDEEENLRRLAACMLAQRVQPCAWVIAENGSTDATAELAQRLAAAHPWITVISTPAADSYDRTSPYMRAFHAGVDALGGAGDVVVKLDADVSLGPDFFKGVLAAFASDPQLGIASGTLFELRGGQWRETILLGAHCWGPTRAYRRSCLDLVLPLDDGIGYASLDEMQAHLAGFRTRTLTHLPFRHHRPEGAGEGSRWRSWSSQGSAAHYTRYRPSYLLARSAYRMRRDPAALGLVTGYLASAMRRAPRHRDERVIEALRDQQRARRLATVVRGRIRRARTSD
jgi:glycosyltransferase involved in cell wall biosynthesis